MASKPSPALPCGPPIVYSGAMSPGEALLAGRRPPKVLPESVHRMVPLNAEEHAEGLWRNFEGDDDTWFYLSSGPFKSKEEFTKMLSTIVAMPKSERVWFCVLGAEGEPVGFVSLMRIECAMGSIEIGSVTFSRAMRSTVLSTASHAALLRWCFEDLNFRRVEWKCDSYNARSFAAALRLGFLYEGLFRNASHYKGRSRDTIWLGMTDTDFQTVVGPAHRSWLGSLDPKTFKQQGKALQQCFAEARHSLLLLEQEDSNNHREESLKTKRIRLPPVEDIRVVQFLNTPGYCKALATLYSNTWWGKGRTPAQISAMLQGSAHIGVVRGSGDDDGELIGFARAITDGVFKATLVDVMVAEEWRSRGVGTMAVREIMRHPLVATCELVDLNCMPDRTAWYESMGFSQELRVRRMIMKKSG